MISGRQSFELVSAVLLALVLLAPLGCSISASSSGSSSPENKETQYRNDVRDFTASYVKSGGRMDEFRRRLGDLARERGITNWEDNLVTYDGIGRGLGKAQASQVELDTYTANLSGGNANKAKAIRSGYDAEKG